jgi:hypothetical protein
LCSSCQLYGGQAIVELAAEEEEEEFDWNSIL